MECLMLCTKSNRDPVEDIKQQLLAELSKVGYRFTLAQFELLHEEWQKNPLAICFPFTPQWMLELIQRQFILWITISFVPLLGARFISLLRQR